jgi:hypothetical protein
LWVPGWVGGPAYGKDRERPAGVRTGSEKYMLSFHPGNAEWAVLPRCGLYN